MDTKVHRSENEGKIIQKPIEYRLDILQRGTVLLQETKFICDLLENVLRQLIIIHKTEHDITYNMFKRNCPDWEATFNRYDKEKKINLNDVIATNFIMTLTFYQITEIISRNWIFVCKTPTYIRGLGNYFRKSASCREVGVFNREMKKVRDTRNAIAHSQKLFSKDDIQNIFNLVNKWLEPIDIDISQKVLSYRKDRPRFLEDLEIMKGSQQM